MIEQIGRPPGADQSSSDLVTTMSSQAKGTPSDVERIGSSAQTVQSSPDQVTIGSSQTKTASVVEQIGRPPREDQSSSDLVTIEPSQAGQVTRENPRDPVPSGSSGLGPPDLEISPLNPRKGYSGENVFAMSDAPEESRAPSTRSSSPSSSDSRHSRHHSRRRTRSRSRTPHLYRRHTRSRSRTPHSHKGRSRKSRGKSSGRSHSKRHARSRHRDRSHSRRRSRRSPSYSSPSSSESSREAYYPPDRRSRHKARSRKRQRSRSPDRTMLNLIKHLVAQSAPTRDTGSAFSRRDYRDQSMSAPGPREISHTATSGSYPPPITSTPITSTVPLVPVVAADKSTHSGEESFKIHPSGDDFDEDSDSDSPPYKRVKKTVAQDTTKNLTFPPITASETPLASSSTAEREEVEDADKQLDLKFAAAIEALYALVPSLPPPVAEEEQEATPMSSLASDPKKEEKSRYRYFPQSTLVQDCVDQVQDYWWDTPKAQADLSLPKNLPPNASWSKPLDTRTPKLTGFKDTFYKDPKAAFPIDPPSLGGQWERNFGKAPAMISVDYTKFVALERMIRRYVATLSSIDVLVAGLRQHSANWESMSEEQRNEASAVSARLTGCLTLAISHSAAIGVRAAATCTQTRRKAVLDNARTREIPEQMREWLLCQPLPQQKSYLFGPAVSTLLKELSVDVEELRKNMALMARPPRSDPKPEGGFSKGHKGKKSFGRGHSSAPQYQSAQPARQPYNQGKERFPRKRKGRGRGKFSFPNSTAATTPKGESMQRP